MGSGCNEPSILARFTERPFTIDGKALYVSEGSSLFNVEITCNPLLGHSCGFPCRLPCYPRPIIKLEELDHEQPKSLEQQLTSVLGVLSMSEIYLFRSSGISRLPINVKDEIISAWMVLLSNQAIENGRKFDGMSFEVQTRAPSMFPRLKLDIARCALC